MSLEERKYIGRQVGLHPDSGKRVIVPVGKCPEEDYNVGRLVGVHPESGKRIFAVSDGLCDPDGNLVQGYRYLGRQVGVHPESGKRIFAVGCKNCESENCGDCDPLPTNWSMHFRWTGGDDMGPLYRGDICNALPPPNYWTTTRTSTDSYEVTSSQDCGMVVQRLELVERGMEIDIALTTQNIGGGNYKFAASCSPLWPAEFTKLSYYYYDYMFDFFNFCVACGYFRYGIYTEMDCDVFGFYCNKINFNGAWGTKNCHGVILLTVGATPTLLEDMTTCFPLRDGNSGCMSHTSRYVYVFYNWFYFNCNGPCYAAPIDYYAPNGIPYGALPGIVKMVPA